MTRDVSAETATSPLWVVVLVECALVCAVLGLSVDVPMPGAIEIEPGAPPAAVDDTVEVALQYAAAGRCSDVRLDGHIDTLIELQVLRQRNGHLGTDQRYIVAEAMHALRSCRGGAATRSTMPGGCTDEVAALLEQRIERERRGGWGIQRRQLVEMTEHERALALASVYMQCVPVP